MLCHISITCGNCWRSHTTHLLQLEAQCSRQLYYGSSPHHGLNGQHTVVAQLQKASMLTIGVLSWHRLGHCSRCKRMPRPTGECVAVESSSKIYSEGELQRHNNITVKADVSICNAVCCCHGSSSTVNSPPLRDSGSKASSKIHCSCDSSC